MKVELPNLRVVAFDCPWTGHVYGGLTVRNSQAPHLLGKQCVKCGCLVYVTVEPSPILDAGGVPIVGEGGR